MPRAAGSPARRSSAARRRRCPGLYGKGDYDLAGFAVGAVERDAILPRNDLAAGDAILGLASAGLHSNGFSLVRRVVEVAGLRWTDPAPFEPETALGAALLKPTRIYVRACLDAIRETGAVKALAHITGGGLVENVPRVIPENLAAEIDLAAIDVPPVFRWLAGPVEEAELLRTFNCGIGMVAVVDRDAVSEVAAVFERHGETVVLLGTIAPRKADAITFSGRLNVDG